MFLAAILLAGAAPSSASPSLASLFSELQNVCLGSLDRGSVDVAAKRAGWLATLPMRDRALAAEVKQYDGEMYADWQLRQAFYTKTVSGRRIYLCASEGRPDGKTIQKCSIFIVGYPRAPKRNEVRSSINAVPTLVSSDFGGAEYNFDNLKLPNNGQLAITWLTHKIRPGFEGDKWANQFAESIGGPQRPPTLSLEISRETN